MLITLTGKSCSGKDTIKKELLACTDWANILTTTTRPKRKGEKEGVNYHFVTSMEFLSMVQNGEMAEFKEYVVADGSVWMYGSPTKEIERAEDDNYIIILTPQGVRDIKTSFPHIPIKIFYIYANYKTISERLKNRGDKSDEADRRIRKDDEDFKGWENEVDKIVYNNLDDDVENVVKKILGYCNEEGNKKRNCRKKV